MTNATSQNHLVISALGADRPGIVDALSQHILDCGCNIADSRMTVLGGEFAIMLLVSGNWNTVAKLEQGLDDLGRRLNLTLTFKRTAEHRKSDNTLPYSVEVVAMDHPGIVHHLANFFSTRGINIQELSTSSYAAAHTGTPMFSLQMVVNIPATMKISGLREEFFDFCDQRNLDALIEPIKI